MFLSNLIVFPSLLHALHTSHVILGIFQLRHAISYFHTLHMWFNLSRMSLSSLHLDDDNSNNNSNNNNKIKDMVYF